jgi:GNAT superfamily N-acetyltransferase
LSPPTTDVSKPSSPLASSASGAQLRSVRAAEGVEFLRRFGLGGDLAQTRTDAWAAFEDRVTLIGACLLTRISKTAFRAQVAVAPERRRLGIGGELLGIMIREAAAAKARLLTGSSSASAVEARRLVESLGLVSARRVHGGRADIVIFVPRTAPTPPGGPR